MSSEPEMLLHSSYSLYGTVELCKYPKPDTYIRENPKIGRNDPCPCGSGRKYKRCCLDKKEEVMNEKL